MNYLTLDIVKKHLNVESEFTDDDSYIELLTEVAEEKVAKELCVSVADLATIDGGKTIPAPIKQAILLSVGAYYAFREDISTANLKGIPVGVKHLLSLYRNYSL